MAQHIYKTYSEQMRPFVPCHAFWNPVPDTILAAGSYGYVDRQGDWKNLGNIRDNPNIASLFVLTVDRNLGWGIRSSRCIERVENQVAMSIIPPQLPAQFNVCFQLTGSGTAGALLISSHKVTSKQLDRPDYQKQWAYGNARAIREADDDVSIHGFFLVEKIWTSPEAWTAAFQSQDRGGTIAFNANVYEAAGVDIGRKWFCSSISQGGNHRSVEEARQCGSDDGVKSYVVAIGGHYFRYCRFKKYRIYEVNPANQRRLHWFSEPRRASAALNQAMRSPESFPDLSAAQTVETITNAELTGLLDEADRHPHDDVFYQIEDSEGKPIAAEEFNRLETTSSQAGHTRTVTEGYDLVGLRLSDVPMIEPPEMAQEVDRL